MAVLSKIKSCCYCGMEVSSHNGRHVYSCKENPNKGNMSKSDIKIEYLKYNYPELFEEDLVRSLYLDDKWSLPDFNKTYKIDYKSMQVILDFFLIHKRDSTESAKLEVTRNKYKTTCMNKYGEYNVSRVPEIKAKRNTTMLDIYGSDNVFSSEWFMNKMQARWDAMSLKEKQDWVRSSLFSKNNPINTSREEFIISKILAEIGEEYEHQGAFDLNFYDFVLPELKLVIEYNGNYWHANPNKYTSNEMIKYPKGEVKASEVWERDSLRKDIVERQGYTMVYLWEEEWIPLKYTEKVNTLQKILGVNSEN